MAGLGLSAASLTAYLDLTLGVKSTFLAESVAFAVLYRFGVTTRSGFAGVCSPCGREGRKIDLRPANVGSLEAKLWFLAGGARVFVDSDRFRENPILLELDAICAAGNGGRGLFNMVFSDRGIFEADAGTNLTGLA